MKGSLAIIGAGNMGGAIYTSLQAAFPQTPVFVCDSELEKLDTLNVPAHFRLKDVNEISSHDIRFILLCIKPQSLSAFKDQLTESLQDKVVISILAGTPVGKVKNATGAVKIVRAMPNLAAFVGKSVTGWIATPQVSSQEKQTVREIFKAFGKETELATEDKIDDITALSGSGPAYFFFLTQLLQEKAEELGFSDEEAAGIAVQTISGASAVLETGVKSAKEWKEAVTSPGGTTQAALEYMNKLQLHNIFKNAIQKSKERAQELSG